MKFRSDAIPSAINIIRGTAGFVLVMLACFVHTEEAAAPFAAPALRAEATTKTAQSPKIKSKSAASGPVERVRTGQRVISALARDDFGTANQFHDT